MEAINESVNQQAFVRPGRTWPRKVGKFLLYGLLLLVLAAALATLVYMYSGSGKWETVTSKKGVTVYSMKVPGSTLKKFRAVFNVKASLSSIVVFMQDDESDLDVDFTNVKVVEMISPQNKVTYWRSGFEKPVQDRDFVVRHTFSQDPTTKAVDYILKALPDMTPREDCCVRVPRMDNTWRFTPLKNGEVQIDWLIDMDVGGFLPFFLVNQIHPGIMVDFGSSLQAIFNRPKYVNAKLAWITEPTP